MIIGESFYESIVITDSDGGVIAIITIEQRQNFQIKVGLIEPISLNF